MAPKHPLNRLLCFGIFIGALLAGCTQPFYQRVDAILARNGEPPYAPLIRAKCVGIGMSARIVQELFPPEPPEAGESKAVDDEWTAVDDGAGVRFQFRAANDTVSWWTVAPLNGSWDRLARHAARAARDYLRDHPQAAPQFVYSLLRGCPVEGMSPLAYQSMLELPMHLAQRTVDPQTGAVHEIWESHRYVNVGIIQAEFVNGGLVSRGDWLVRY